MGVNGSSPAADSAAEGAPAPPFDAELGAALSAKGLGASSARVPLTADNLVARQERDAAARPRPTLSDLRAEGSFEVEELRVPGRRGEPDVTLVSARPAGLTGPLPLLYYLHGGGMVMGNAWSVLPRLLVDWALPLGLAVISVEYRLAPRSRYPAQLEDCYSGLVWAVENAHALGVDAQRVIIGGKSAGGGLAAALALLVRDRGGPEPIGQLLLCPMLDDRGTTFSSHQLNGIGTGDRVSSATMWQALLGDAYGTADVPPYAAPARATDLSGLPPPTWTSGRPRCSGTRTSPTRTPSGKPEARRNCTSGPAPSTASTPSHPRRPSAWTHATPASAGSAGSSAGVRPTDVLSAWPPVAAT